MKLENTKEITVGIISDGKYGERAYANIKKRFETKWILVPEIDSTIMIDDDLEFDIPNCDLYISYVRHPDIILQLAELQKPLILGVLPGIGLYKQAKSINPKIIHAPTMCSLENNNGIQEVDYFTTFFGRPEYEIKIDDEGKFKNIKLKRSSLCGSSQAGANFLIDKEFHEDSLKNFALSVCHECRAPRFGHTCDKEVAGIIHLNSLFDGLATEKLLYISEGLRNFIQNMKEEYEIRYNNSRKVLNQVRKNN